jgi:hypothetical protein
MRRVEMKVFAVTAAWTPALRKDEMDKAHDVWRMIATLSVDVPIFMW